MDGKLPLPWLAEPLRRALQTQRAHALLVHGPKGVGQFELSLGLAQAWLCEGGSDGAAAARPCGDCASCRLVRARSHPDLLVLLPEVLRDALGWGAPAAEAEAGADKAGKAKPSKEIKVEAVRSAVAFAQTTSARGRGKVVLLHPAERMNVIAANTLLKTLEEPPGDARFLLGCAAPDDLLPTIRSRCQAVRLGLPPTAVASVWLAQQGVAQPDVLLAATGGQPLEALEWVGLGIDAALWSRLPALVRAGEPAPVAGWPLPLLIDALQKLCHDAACRAAGAMPRYFPAATIAAGSEPGRLNQWSRELQRAARHAEHPWNAGLMTESLFQQGARALAASSAARGRERGAWVHSRA